MTRELEDAMNKAITSMREHGAMVINSVNVTGADDHKIHDDLWSLFLTTFRQDIENYLSELSNTSIRTLNDLIEFNLHHTDEEFHPLFAPNQHVFELSNNVTKSSYINQSSLVNKTRLWGGRLGIDAM